MDVVPVAVDVQVRRVTENLGVTDTAALKLDDARPIIQAAWRGQVRHAGADGPEALRGTDATLDPALWFWGKWGRSFCERAGAKMPIGQACGACQLLDRGDGVAATTASAVDTS